MKDASTYSSTSTIGIVEWFRPGQYQEVEQAIIDFKRIGIRHIRTGVSWADWHAPGTEEWYDWLFPKLSGHLEILPCFLYTPPSVGEVQKVSSPPKESKAFA